MMLDSLDMRCFSIQFIFFKNSISLNNIYRKLSKEGLERRDLAGWIIMIWFSVFQFLFRNFIGAGFMV